MRHKSSETYSMMTIMANMLSVSLLVLTASFKFGAGLSTDYYFIRCPSAATVVRDIVDGALQQDSSLAAPLVRMLFHDCFIQGCDGSILIDSTDDNTAEKDAPSNYSLRGFEIIDNIKEELEKRCPRVVSCADILAMAARDAVFFAGGPFYDIPTGRKDGRRSDIDDTHNLPSPSFNASQLLSLFAQHGFSAQDLVALSGAHTLGVASCGSFRRRLAPIVDPTLDSDFAKMLWDKCNAGDDTVQPFDATMKDFDNLYFNPLVSRKGVLRSDQALYGSPRTTYFVDTCASGEAMLFLHFQQAMLKLSLLDVKEGAGGEVRQNCRKIN